jgi:hypothetical protein
MVKSAMLNSMPLMGTLFVLAVAPLAALAQQPLPRPIVLYRPGTTTTAQPNPNPTQSPRPTTLTTKPVAAPTDQFGSRNSNGQATQPGNQQDASTTGQSQKADDNQPKTPQQEWEDEQKRPTYQQLLNPSAGWNLTHSGFTNAQQMTPNTFFGPQFQTWTNQQAAWQMPSTYGELSRFQPGQFGGYVGPNTFVGTGFNSWTNQSPGGISPGATGSWGLSVWP